VSQRAIGYGRKSFDDPDNRTASVADQETFARTYAERNDLQFVDWQGDDGISGATMERPGLQRLLAAIVARQADVVIIEDVDRLSRDQEHLQHMSKMFRVHGVVLHTVAAGVIDHLVLSVKGMIGEQQRMRIAYTTRRGLVGKAKRGGVTGGKTLGYMRAQTGSDPSADQLVVDDSEAALVRRIFELYADGASLKSICNLLNAEGVPSPRARERGKYNSGIWNPSTLSGSVELGEGVLNNSLYVGRRIFNRRTWVEVPNDKRGFRRVPRLNPEADWIVRDEPHLRIVDEALWQRVKVRQADARAARDHKFKLTGNPLAGAKRPGHLLSGLVVCGTCGGPFVGTGGRWRCKAAMRQACDNASIRIDQLENRVLAGVREQLLTPEIISKFASALQQELDEKQQVADAGRGDLELRLADVRERMARLGRRIEEDEDAPRVLIERLKALETEEGELTAAVSATPARSVVRLPANYALVYERAVEQLEQHLRSEEGNVAREAIRVLIDRIVVQPGDERGGKRRHIQLHGDLFEMLTFAEAAAVGLSPAKRREQNAQKPQSGGTGAFSVTPLVAGTGFEPVTFRL
jgi:site-specific DNA recombinase